MIVNQARRGQRGNTFFTQEDIANQMDLELSEVTFVGIVDQRKSPPLPGDEGIKIKSFKKSYFQDAIADMR